MDVLERTPVATSELPPQPALGPLPPLAHDALLGDYLLAYQSRQISIVVRREVLSGNAKFGVFGDGKELCQIALARAMLPGDWRSGYYRDQTLALALGIVTPQQLFAQLYGDTDAAHEPASGGRSMINHFSSRLLDAQGRWLPQRAQANTSADISPTAGQMPRLVGLAYASKIYRALPALDAEGHFSQSGDEVAFATIGNASCAEGMFWEAINAIGLLQVPAVVSVWDDGYGISVPNELQLSGGDLGPLLRGFRYKAGAGCDVYTVRGWDYPALLKVYRDAAGRAREQHIPAVVHVTELTQPQGHSTSGSNERYKSPERLQWESDYDPLPLMRAWLLRHKLIDPQTLAAREAQVRDEVEAARARACEEAGAPMRADAQTLADRLDALAADSPQGAALHATAQALRGEARPLRRQLLEAASRSLAATRGETSAARAALVAWRNEARANGHKLYGTGLLSDGPESPLKVAPVPPQYGERPQLVRGFEVLQANFDALLARDERIFLFGEDVGRLGDVNQGAAGLQARYGALRVADTGIREATIVGQAIGMALRGLRPIAEIQYLDYIYYALMTLTDDLACTRWRSAGGQKAPVIIRTRGHRLEGVWHSGSPISALLGSLRGMHLAVPRDMTRAAGFYNTLLRGDDPALVIETLNGYRQREPLPENLGAFTLPLGLPELLRAGSDVTVVTYGACCRIALEAAKQLDALGVSLEVIDVQTLLPFDTEQRILESLKKTSRVIFLDEDVPGGASAYMFQQVIEGQNGYAWLDSPPVTLSAQPHRPAYTSDGDYFSKPNVEDVVEAAYALMHECDPASYPALW
jgi:2-oxoisovalerate dehydrogenase E1 component